MKTIVKASALIFMAIGYQVACADPININITGNVVASPCTVDTSSISKDVDFGTVRNTDLEDAGTASAWVPFSVTLSHCPASTRKAKVTFTGNPAAEDVTLYANSGSASNVAVQMAADSDRAQILSNGTSMTVDIDSQHNAEYLLAGRLVSIHGNTGAGTFSSVVQMNFTYQ